VPTICRKTDRRRGGIEEQLDVELDGDAVLVRCRGRVVRTLTGSRATAVRNVLHDDAQLQRLLAREARRR
jgi:hypothetical protein